MERPGSGIGHGTSDCPGEDSWRLASDNGGETRVLSGPVTSLAALGEPDSPGDQCDPPPESLGGIVGGGQMVGARWSVWVGGHSSWRPWSSRPVIRSIVARRLSVPPLNLEPCSGSLVKARRAPRRRMRSEVGAPAARLALRSVSTAISTLYSPAVFQERRTRV